MLGNFLFVRFADGRDDEQQFVHRNEGFDRLLEMGMSQEEVANLRAQFHTLRGTPIDDRPENARNAEEEWMDNPGNTHRDDQGIITGLLINFSFGILRM
eukprot:jgi/Hompol1/5530/HPOL_004509-RA